MIGDDVHPVGDGYPEPPDDEIGDDLGPLEQAHAALLIVERLGALDDEERLDLVARGVKVGEAQRAHLMHAGTCALVAIADSLAVLVDLLEHA